MLYLLPGAVIALAMLGNAALANQGSIPFARISTQEGLSQAAVHAIAQDGTGMMWFGTQEGLNRYDGYRFTTFIADPEDAGSLSHNWIYALLVDNAGTLWIGTNGGGINRRLAGSSHFQRFRHNDEDPTSLSGDRVRVICQDSAGTIWIGTDGAGLNRFDPSTETFVRYGNDPNDPNSLSNDRIRSIAEDPEGGLWIGTDGGGLNWFDPKTGQFRHFRHQPANPGSLSDDRISKVFVDRQNQLWIGTYNGGLNRFQRDSGKFVHYRPDRTIPGAIAPGMVRDIFQDHAGRLWVGTDQGLNLWSQATGGFEHLKHDPGNPMSLSENRVLSIYQDRGGVLWVGTYRGLNKWNAMTGTFRHYHHDRQNPASLSNDTVTAFANAGDRRLWIGTFGGGLDLFDRTTGQFKHFRHQPNQPNSLSDDRVMALFSEASGAVWIGTMNHGLDRFDPVKQRFQHFVHRPTDPHSLSADGVTDIYRDSRGNLWIGTYYGGLNLYDPGTGRFIRFQHDPANPDSLSSNRVLVISEDNQGHLWIGTDGGGLNRYKPDTQSFVRFRHDPAKPNSLSGDHIWSIHCDRNGDLWIGTSEGGLNRWSALNRRQAIASFDHFTQKEGLPSNAIQGLISDQQGYLWISSNRGLSRLDSATFKIKNFTARHGLQGDDFTQGAYLISEDGELFFGGSHGFNAFSPGSIIDNRHVPPVVLTGFYKFNEQVLDTDQLAQVTSLTVGYRDYMIGFEFAALDFTAPEQNRFQYKLEGLDRDWVDAGPLHRATFTNLTAGNYVFRVRAANNEGIWNQAGSSIQVRVTPAPWLTVWAYGAYGVALSLIGLIYFRARSRKLAREMALQRMEAASQAKNEFLATISHEVRTPLNGILGMVTLLAETELTTNQNRFVQTIRRSAQSLLALVNDILDFSKIEAGKIELESIEFDLRQEADETVELLSELAYSKGLELICDIPFDLPTRVLGDPLRFRQILTNLINNAIKFTDQGEVTIRARLESEIGDQNRYRLEVEDTGIGMDQATCKRIFQSFTQADSSTTRKYGGSGLGLTIAEKLVRAMDGEIGVDSEPGQGSRFWFSIGLNPARSASQTLPPVLAGKRVLIISANRTLGEVLQRQCQSLAMLAQTCNSGPDALDRLYRGGRNPPAFDVIVLDHPLKDMDSFSLARMITAAPELNAPPILLLAPLGQVDFPAGEARQPIAAVTAKPIRYQEFLQDLIGALGIEAEVPALVPGAKTSLGNYRILLADDNLTNQEVARIILESFGCQVDTVANGRQAVEACASSNYDLILMDCLMPEMDGLQATRILRDREKTSGWHIPIIALTAGAMEENRGQCLEAGMDEFLSKPFKPEALRQLLENLLAPGKSRNSRSGRSAAKKPSQPAPGTQALLDDKALDLIRSLQRPGQPDLVEHVARIFLRNTPALLTALKQAAAAKDASGLVQAAHSLKSCSAHIGATRLASLARELEARGRKQDLQGASELVALIQQNFWEVKKALEIKILAVREN